MTSPIRSRSESSSPFDQESYETLTCSEPPKSTDSVGTAEDAACHLPSGGGEVNQPSTTTDEQGATSERAVKGGISTLGATFEEDSSSTKGEIFAAKGRDPRAGIEVEALAAGARTSTLQDDAQVALARLGWSSDDGERAARLEFMTAKFHPGMLNPDGTTGLNLGAGVTAAGWEVRDTWGPVSATVAVSVGATLAGSIGVGDRDADGKPELCFRGEGFVGTVGACVEKFW